MEKKQLLGTTLLQAACDSHPAGLRQTAMRVRGLFDNLIKGSLVGETSVLRTFRMSGKELVKERVSQRKS